MRFDDKSVRRENGKHMVGCCDALQVQPKTKPFKHIDARTEFRVFRIFESEVGNFWVFNIEGSTSGKRYRIEIIGVVEV